ncbi:unnamed protein product [Coregonus sp. 'balchen']|nr:unnamed protein product [Coregonus sp. 'balchen']
MSEQICQPSKFVASLDEVDDAYGDLQLHTGIRWMSRAQTRAVQRPPVIRSAKSGPLSHMYPDISECENTIPFNRYTDDIKTLQEQFKDRFQDFHDMQPRIHLFTEPISSVGNEQPADLQMELCELQANPFNQNGTRGGLSFGNCCPSPVSHT